ncbi:GNAT family N-acetyltransferase [Bradyrhizobium sp. HKCCYLRH3097]|jgi:ribosomal protein S18 acetylase RimI-like enzyme|uniref:GNAT family N-acetyltransferase n=2 Tax=Bradyrhizobium TaxID=374 RepID=UPI003EBB6908
MESRSMSPAATIRRLRADDAACFKALRLEALTISPESMGSTFELENGLGVEWFARRLEDTHTLGAFRDGELVGTLGFVVQQGPKHAHKGRLFGMYVKPAFRRSGLARLLANAILDVAREQVEIVQLIVVQDNVPARRLYESIGFVEFGLELKAAKDGGRYYDEAHMALDFSRAADST